MEIATIIVAIVGIAVTVSVLATIYLAAARFADNDPLMDSWFEEWFFSARSSDTDQL